MPTTLGLVFIALIGTSNGQRTCQCDESCRIWGDPHAIPFAGANRKIEDVKGRNGEIQTIYNSPEFDKTVTARVQGARRGNKKQATWMTNIYIDAVEFFYVEECQNQLTTRTTVINQTSPDGIMQSLTLTVKCNIATKPTTYKRYALELQVHKSIKDLLGYNNFYKFEKGNGICFIKAPKDGSMGDCKCTDPVPCKAKCRAVIDPKITDFSGYRTNHDTVGIFTMYNFQKFDYKAEFTSNPNSPDGSWVTKIMATNGVDTRSFSVNECKKVRLRKRNRNTRRRGTKFTLYNDERSQSMTITVQCVSKTGISNPTNTRLDVYMVKNTNVDSCNPNGSVNCFTVYESGSKGKCVSDYTPGYNEPGTPQCTQPNSTNI